MLQQHMAYTKSCRWFGAILSVIPIFLAVSVGYAQNTPIAVTDRDSTNQNVAKGIHVLNNDTDADGHNFFLSIAGNAPGSSNLTSVQGGSLSINRNSSPADSTDDFIDYFPPGAYLGQDTFYYVITDPAGTKDTGMVVMKVKFPNQRPNCLDDTGFLAEDTRIVVVLKANDSDPEGDPFFTIGVFNGPSNGVTLIKNSDSIEYIPNKDFFGVDMFQYLVIDIEGGKDTALVTLTVNPTPDKPDARNDLVSTNEDTPLEVYVLANDIEVDLETMTIIKAGSKQNVNDSVTSRGGSFIHNEAGTPGDPTDDFIDYVPPADYFGMDTAWYLVEDPTARKDTARVIITVVAVNDPPVANLDVRATNEEVPLTIGVRGNDTDIEGDPFTTTAIITPPLHGTALIIGADSVTYTPVLNYFGTDSFFYEITDVAAGKDTGMVMLTVNGVPDKPVALDDSSTTIEDIQKPIFVLDNDSDVDFQNVKITRSGSNPGASNALSRRGGLAPISGNSTPADSTDDFIRYTPPLNYVGLDTIYYVITDPNNLKDTAVIWITILAANDPPEATPDTVVGLEDNVLVIDVQANDFDPDGDPLLTTDILLAPNNGAAVILNDDSIVYTPNPNFYGTDSLEYRISDNILGDDTAKVYITITSVNDPPVALDNTANTLEDVSVSINVLNNDSDVDLQNFFLFGTGIFPGSVNNTSVALGSMTINRNGTPADSTDDFIDYTPANNYFGLDSFYYSIRDPNGARDTAKVVITITGVNDPPIATDDNSTTGEDIAVTIHPLANDSEPDAEVLSTSNVIMPPSNGSYLLIDNDSIRYTPSLNFYGPDSLRYQLSDNNGNFDTATVYITVTPISDPPTAVDDIATTPEDIPAALTVLFNDLDVDGENFFLASTGSTPGSSNNLSTAGGTTTRNQNGTPADSTDDYIAYIPPLNFFGHDTVYYGITDPAGLQGFALVDILVTAVNDPPVAVGESAIVKEDSFYVQEVLSNDSDPEGDPISLITISKQPKHGTAVIVGSDSILYTPNANYFGPDTLTYRIGDGNGGFSTALFVYSVSGVNDPPVAVDDIGATNEDVGGPILVLVNDIDIEGGPNSLDAVGSTPGSNNNLTLRGGTATINDNGTPADLTDDFVLYQPLANYFGNDTCFYTISDPLAEADTAMIVINVVSVNDPPVGVDDVGTLDEETSIVTHVLLNDTDIENDPLSTSFIISSPANGMVSVLNNDSISYTPNVNFFGVDSYTYQVSDGKGGADTATVNLTINNVPDKPIASNDAATTDPGVAVIADVQRNDIDHDGDVLTTAIISGPSNGTANLQNNDSIQYTPNVAFLNGLDTIVYSVCDGGPLCDTAMLIITVPKSNLNPIAANDNSVIEEDNSIVHDVQGNDFDPNFDPITTSILTQPSNGTAVVLNGDSISYTPNLNFFGLDTVAYEVCDTATPSLCASALWIIQVNPINDAPVFFDDSVSTLEDIAISLKFSQSDVEGHKITNQLLTNAQNGTAMVSNDSLYYTPNNNFNGMEVMTVRACDNGVPSRCDTATIKITVIPDNDAPHANNDTVTIEEDASVIIHVKANDTDEENDPLTTSLFSFPVNGAATVLNSDSIRYVPNSNFNGSEKFIYRINDGQGGTDTASVVITILPVDDRPVAVNDLTATNPGVMININVQQNDSDADGDPLTTTMILPPKKGLFSIVNGNSIDYTPLPSFLNGADTLHYQVCDPVGLCDTAIAVILVPLVNLPPVALNETLNVNEDGNGGVNILANDMDLNGDSIVATIIIQPTNGNASLINGDSIAYTPNPNFYGVDLITYEVCDTVTPPLCDTAVVSITVNPVNDGPIAVDDNANTIENSPVTTNLLANDSDLEGKLDTAGVLIYLGPSNGSFNYNGANGDVTYTPAPGYFGLDTLWYAVCDTGQPVLCDSAILVIDIQFLNDPPTVLDDATTTDEDTPVTLNVATNDSDPDNNLDVGSISITVNAANGNAVVQGAAGEVTYSPDLNFFGVDSFTYQVCDLGVPALCQTGVVVITVNPVNDPPVVGDDSDSTAFGTAVDISIFPNDTDPENDIDLSTIQLIMQPANGVAAMDSNNMFLHYEPDTFITDATDTIWYSLCDSGTPSLCDTGMVVVYVGPKPIPNFKPVALDDSGSVLEGQEVTIAVLENDSDPDNNLDPSSLRIITAPTPPDGTAQIVGEDMVFKSETDFVGWVMLEYEVCDLGFPIRCDTASVMIEMFPELPTPYNGISPNNDGQNDAWLIPGIEAYPNNKVNIFNRWGGQVWGAEGYDNNSIVFLGNNQVGEPLPGGTYYYYVIELEAGGKSLSGWVFITKD